jgi:hypothetical protein
MPSQDDAAQGRVRFVAAGAIAGLILGVVLAIALKAPGSVLVSKLLDWPFLLFCGLLLFVVLFFRPLHNLLGRGDILLSWGEGRSIRLRELSKRLDQEFDPVHDDIEELRNKLEKLQTQSNNQTGAVVAEGHSFTERHSPTDARQRILGALKNGKWRWRSLETLSSIAGISEQQTLDLLRSESEVVLGKGKSGRRIARHRSR